MGRGGCNVCLGVAMLFGGNYSCTSELFQRKRENGKRIECWEEAGEKEKERVE